MDHEVGAMKSSPSIQFDAIFDKEAIAPLRYYFEIPEKKREKLLAMVKSMISENS